MRRIIPEPLRGLEDDTVELWDWEAGKVVVRVAAVVPEGVGIVVIRVGGDDAVDSIREVSVANVDVERVLEGRDKREVSIVQSSSIRTQTSDTH